MSARRIAVVMSGFPRRSETFALGELLALEERGVLDSIFATKPGEAGLTQPGCERLLGKLRVLPEGDPARQAAYVAGRLASRRVGGVHGYFAHTPAEVAARAARLLGLPYGFSTHARDARKVAPHVLAERASKAACVVACNTDVAEEILRGGGAVHLLPHGVDLRRFRPRPQRDSEELRLLAVGRLVEKKGFHVLLDAASLLDLPFRLRIVGSGPEREQFAECERLGASRKAAHHDCYPARSHASSSSAASSARMRSRMRGRPSRSNGTRATSTGLSASSTFEMRVAGFKSRGSTMSNSP